jgi:hypothetical protein
MLKDQNPQKSQRMMQAMMQMKKIDIPGLEAAYGQSSSTAAPTYFRRCGVDARLPA